MNRIVLAILLPFVLPAWATAQQPVSATLTPKDQVLAAGSPATLMLRVEVREDAELDAHVLRGLHLTTKVGDQDGATLGEPIAEKVAVAAGTVVERALEVDLPPLASGSALQRIALTWPGLPGATTTLMIAPDQSGIDVDLLDLAKTQVLLVTNFGTMTVEFLADKAPNHAKNFVKLSKSGFYDGTRFHRVIRGFMIQGGCPNTKDGAEGAPGTGNPGYTVDAEFNDVRHTKGILSAARGPDPNSAGCQFFVVQGDANWLDNKYSAFGRLVAGVDTLDKIADVAVVPDARGETSVPTEPIHLYKAIVLPVLK